MTNLLEPIGSTSVQPQIVVAEGDHRTLTALALAGIGHDSDEADNLLYELERARVLPAEAVPADAVRMGTRVTYRTETGAVRTVTLVYPVDADIAQGRISVLTPVGTALIGLTIGQSIAWTGRDGHKHVLTVTGVEQTAA
jgi:regulator of nucleoside diphosphate kinase